MKTLIALAAVVAGTTALTACAMDGGGGAYSPRLTSKAADEKAFATTFASCRDQVRTGKTGDFKLSPAAATDTGPRDTGLTLKVPYDKAKGGSRAARSAQDTAHKASMDRCLGENGYAVAGWDAKRR